jgi:ABC-type antimicrobial peptide transport system permease subunit
MKATLILTNMRFLTARVLFGEIMGLKSSLLIAWRSLSRRKTKNLSVILAVTLGVTLLVGIQITTDTLKTSFLTSLLQREGEVDLQIANATTGAYLKASDQQSIADLLPDALGIMPELTTQIPALVESQFDPKMAAAGILTDYPEAFGSFYDWQSGNKTDLNALLTDNSSILLSSTQAEKLGLTEDTHLPVTLTTEFTNLTAVISESPTVPLSGWMVNSNFTTGEYIFNSSSLGLSLELNPVTPFSTLTVFTINSPQLNLSDYAHVNVTATGSNNARILLGFSSENGTTLNLVNWTDTQTLNTTTFDLAPYAGEILRGDAYCVLMSSNGTQATIDIKEITFEPLSPVISYVPEISRVDLQIVGIFDSNRPGIGSQYSGVVFRLDHLQQWLSLQYQNRETDKVSAFLVTFKQDHFVSEIEEDYLKSKVELLDAAIPSIVNPQTGKAQKIYQVSSARLDFFSIAGFIISLLGTILTALGFLVMLTGILLITNVQLMSVEDREFQTGVLRAVGENRRGIFQSMMIENLFQGVIGGILGFLGGLAFGQGVAVYLAGLFGTGELSVKPVISQEIVILSVVIGVVLSIVTGILPALRASQVNIVEALRGIKVAFEAKSGRNLATLGVIMTLGGVILLLYNGVFEPSYQVFWSSKGWDTLEEWRALLIGFGLLSGGLGIVLSKFISRTKAFNITAITLYVMPAVLFVVAMGNWITNITGIPIEILILGLIEIIIGSVMFVAFNLPILMRGLRRILIRVKGLKGVGQISPALISSHVTRSTLTFAIFAIILTLNVIVATLIPTFLGTLSQTEDETRGIDLSVFLNKPEAIINGTSYSQQLYNVDERITDVIGLKSFQPKDYTKFSALNKPFSSDFDASTDILPISLGEFKSDQIRGNASDSLDPNWRYDFYLSSFLDGVRQSVTPDITDPELLELSKKAWDKFFDPEYKMAAYNVTSELLAITTGESDISDLDFGAFTGSSEDPLKDAQPLRDQNGSLVENPIVFTDSMLLPVGLQIWIPMNTSSTGFPVYQAFTIGGRLDSQRGGGFPLAASLGFGSEDFDFSSLLGSVYLPEYWANQTNFLGEADGKTAFSREPDQYDFYLIKTTLRFNDPELQSIAQAIEDFTNTNNQGYRLLSGDNYTYGSSSLIYARVETTLEMTDRIASFLQIYVSFGLAIGAVGMGVISVRNVAERKREIGMMRAIGFPRKQVMLSVLLELVVLGIIGLIIGIVNGLLVSVGFANLQNMPLIIPWGQLGLYLSFIVLIAIGAGSIPAYIASRIPPAEALRYVG